MKPCSKCAGSGEMPHPRWGGRSCPDPTVPCPACAGTGEVAA